MRKSLKLKKIKISQVGNIHSILAGALNLPAGNIQTLPVTFPVTYTLDTKLDDTCNPGTNDGGGQRTGIASRNVNGLRD